MFGPTKLRDFHGFSMGRVRFVPSHIDAAPFGLSSAYAWLSALASSRLVVSGRQLAQANPRNSDPACAHGRVGRTLTTLSHPAKTTVKRAGMRRKRRVSVPRPKFRRRYVCALRGFSFVSSVPCRSLTLPLVPQTRPGGISFSLRFYPSFLLRLFDALCTI